MKLFRTISLLASLCGAALAAETDKPHMVVILVDDMGYGDPEGQLYNLADDLGETTNLYAQQPEIVAQLKAEMDRSVDTGRSRPIAENDPLRPYRGPSVSGVDTSTLTGKVMCGYQGWFNCEGDGADLGWTHWARNKSRQFAPGNITVDLWPDMSELGPDERFVTGFHYADGRPAEVFSSHKRKTVVRHFEWMRDYGIDGAFVQRFAHGLKSETMRHHKDVLLANAREGANRAGRAYAVMYDLTSLPAGGTTCVCNDWRRLRHRMQITEDPAYVKHNGGPVVAVWGVGFNDKSKPRQYTLDECRKLIEFLKADGCTVMLGVATGWRQQTRDAMADPQLHEVLQLADIISPWTVGRYRDLADVTHHAKNYWKPDVTWCDQHEMDYLPVVFPGFSWHHQKGDVLGKTPRLRGQFFWSQIVAAKRAGANMIYVAMFDEVDEGTAIFKCTNEPPTGDGVPFLTYEGLPSDYYLRLTGQAGKLLRGALRPTETIPVPSKNSIRANRNERCLTSDVVRERGGAMTQRNSRSFDAIPRIIANREWEKMEAHSPTLGSPRFGATHAPLGAGDIPIVLPWWSAFRESSRVDSQQ
jgi:hypothetical protein